MLVLVCVAQLWISSCFTLLLKARRGLQKTTLMPAKLCAVLATFGFSEMSCTNSVQCQRGRNLTPSSVRLRRVTYFANISVKMNFKKKP